MVVDKIQGRVSGRLEDELGGTGTQTLRTTGLECRLGTRLLAPVEHHRVK